MKTIAGWIGRKTLLYVVLVAAVAFYVLAWPRIASEFSADSLRQDVSSSADVSDEIAALKAVATQKLKANAQAIGTLGPEAVASQLEATQAELTAAKTLLAQSDGALNSLRPSKIIQRKRSEIGVAVLKQQVAFLELASNREEARNRLAQYAEIPTLNALAVAENECQIWRERGFAFDRKYPIERGARTVLFDERAEIESSRKKYCDLTGELRTRRKAGLEAADAMRQATRDYDDAASTASNALDAIGSPTGQKTMRDILITAAVLLLGIMLVPLVIRVVFYYALAPLAMRRPAIRLTVPGSAENDIAIPPAECSATSVPVSLASGEELLVRQDYLQSLPETGHKRTRWLLDFRHPFSSIASGMMFLTRIVGTDETVTISAVRDPFAEVTLLTIPAGGSCVMQPRALAAVVQSAEVPMRITSHWRLFSLNAWLTLQLRYLVFHGPARLVIKGGRGVRVERARNGRVFGQDQLVGFSADLKYSVTRTETFWPYLLGRQPLFKDRVQGGTGSLILEESPLGARGSAGPRGGLEGMFDAGLKAFGL